MLIVSAAGPAVAALLLLIFTALNQEPRWKYPDIVYTLLMLSPFLIIGLFFLSILSFLFMYLQTGLSRDAYVDDYIRRSRDRAAARLSRIGVGTVSTPTASAPVTADTQSILNEVPVQRETAAPLEPGAERPVSLDGPTEQRSDSAAAAVPEQPQVTPPPPVVATDVADANAPSASIQVTPETIRDIKESVVAAAASDLVDYIRRVGEHLDSSRRIEDLERRTTVTLKRTQAAIDASGWRANVNLLIGFAVTAMGISGLLWFITRQPEGAPADLKHFAAYYAPRLVMVVIIEVFAYFFLQLYKAGLEDIKYYNNEMTNAEVPLRALSVALHTVDATARTDMLRHLATTDRNLVSTREAKPSGKVEVPTAQLTELVGQLSKLATSLTIEKKT